MENPHNLSRRVLHLHPIKFMLLLLAASFFAHSILAGSIPTVASPMEKSRCEKTPTQCRSLCEEDIVAEARARDLKNYSKKTRRDSERAIQKAAALQKQVNQTLRKMGTQMDPGSPGTAGPKPRSIWKAVSVIPRLLVSKESNARARAQEKEAQRDGTNQPLDHADQNFSELLLKSQMASETADNAQRVASSAENEADTARAYAESVRKSYKSCLTR